MSRKVSALALVSALAQQTLGIAMPLDATALEAGAPALVTELDLGKLKGELRQIGWSPDGTQLYIQTVDGTPPAERPRHYLVPATGGAPASVDRQPEWAQAYWAFERPIPGLMFSWGPRGTGVIAYTGSDGRLRLLDQERRKQTIDGVKDAMLPAWSTDGERLAYAQKSGRRKFRLMLVTLTRK